MLRLQQATISLKNDEFEHYAELLNSSQKGIIVCGQIDDEGFFKAVVALAEKLKFPILADPLSQLRSGEHSGDILLIHMIHFYGMKMLKRN